MAPIISENAATKEPSKEGVVKKDDIEKWDGMLKDGKSTPASTDDYYSKEAHMYDMLMEHLGWTDVRYTSIAKIMSEYFPDKEERGKLKILDLASGTGPVGQYIHPLGFRNMDAIDGNAQMLEELKRKGIYDKATCLYIGNSEEPIEGVEDGSYDVVTMCGGLAPGHIKIQVFRQIARALKKGGLFVHNCSIRYLHLEEYKDDKPLDLMWKMDKEKVWKFVLSLELLDNPKPCVSQVFRKL